MSYQAGRPFFKITEVALKELSELRHIHHFTVGKPSIKEKRKILCVNRTQSHMDYTQNNEGIQLIWLIEAHILLENTSIVMYCCQSEEPQHLDSHGTPKLFTVNPDWEFFQD